MQDHNATLFAVFTSAIDTNNIAGNPALVRLWTLMPETKTLIALSIAQAQQTLVCISPRQINQYANTSLNNTSHFNIRWFFAGKEIQRCGHGTLAAAAYIDNTRHHTEHPVNDTTCYFHSLAGETLITSTQYDQLHQCNRYILLLEPIEFLQTRYSHHPSFDIPAIIIALDTVYPITSTCWAATKLPQGYIIIKLASAIAVSEFILQPHLIDTLGDNVLIVSSINDQVHHDIAFRYFAPAYGNHEDSATGSAAPILYAFWQPLLKHTTLRARQLSTAGGEMSITEDQQKISVSGYINQR